MTKQSVTCQLKRSHDLQHSSWVFTWLDRQSQRPDPINQQVMSSPTNYIIVLCIFFKLLLWQTNNLLYSILKMLEGSG